MKAFCFYSMILGISLGVIACNTGSKAPVAEAPAGNAAFDMQKAKSFIDSINLKFTEEFRRGDSVALAAHYSPDAELLFAHSEPIKGKDILSAWGSMCRMGLKDFTFETTDLQADSQFLIETGTYLMTAQDNSVAERGKYVVVWRNENGEWKLYRDMGNTSMAETPAK